MTATARPDPAPEPAERGPFGLLHTCSCAASAEHSATVLSALGTVGSAANSFGPPLSGALATLDLQSGVE